MRLPFAVLLLSIAGCAGTSLTETTGPERWNRDIVPRVDHHQHLLGPTALLPPPPQLPAVELPQELAQLLEQRAALYARATPGDLSRLFTPDAQMVSWQRPSRWVRGEEALLGMLNGVIDQQYRFEANAFGIDGSQGHISGHVSVVAGDAAQPVLDFLLGISQGEDGLWRIAAESISIKSAPQYSAPITADKVIADLDEAGIERAIVLSVAFWLGGRFPDPADEMTREYDAVRAENDWTAEQVAKYPQRLVMAFSVNPLKQYAIRELERCAGTQVKACKLHFADSQVDLNNPEHLEMLRRFFAAANERRMPLILHLKPRTDYGPKEVETFLSELVGSAPDIPIQIAHLAGDGPGIDAPEALEAFARACEAEDPRTRNLYFDFAGLVTRDTTTQQLEVMALRMRQIGLHRIVYGSDGQPPNQRTAEHWIQSRARLPLTESELRQIAQNIPYLR